MLDYYFELTIGVNVFKKSHILFCIFSFSASASCLDLNGVWEGPCNRDGVVKNEVLRIRQESCQHINFYRVDYKIGKPYEQRHENNYEKMINIFNFRWDKNSSGLLFDVDRIRWMKDKNIVSTGEGIGVIKVDGDKMLYSRTYTSRNREGIYSKKTRKCEFIRS